MQFFSPAQCIGYVAFVFGVTAFLQKDDRRLKLLIASECLAYTLHFRMLGNLPASLSAFVSSGRCLLALKTRSIVLAVLIIALNLALGVAYVTTNAGWLPVISSCLGTVAVFALEGLAMRLVLMVCTLLWLANNIITGSVGGTLLETTIALANLATMIRLGITPSKTAGTDVPQPVTPCAPTLALHGAGAKPGR